MSTRFEADDSAPLEPRDLAEFEAELYRSLEQRLVHDALVPTEPTADEAAQLARMAAHMEVRDLVRRPRSLRLVHDARAAAYEASALEQTFGAPSYSAVADGDAPRLRDVTGNLAAFLSRDANIGARGAPRWPAAGSRRDPRAARLRIAAALAAAALGVLLLRGWVPGTAGAEDLAAPRSGAERATSDAYLSADRRAGGTGSAFEGRLTWDARGQDGVVCVTVFDRADGELRKVSEEYVAGPSWTPSGPLPQRFCVLVDRPADDGVSREELLWAERFLP